MSRAIEDYALIGDLHSAALVGLDGSIDWLCLPRFDSDASFAALLGDERHGHWQIAPAAPLRRVRRRYRPDTLVLETEFSTASGTVRLTDCMPPRSGDPVVLRLVEGLSGRVDMRMTLAPRFEYGLSVPRLRGPGTPSLTAGAQAYWVFSPLALSAGEGSVSASFPVVAGDQIPVALVWGRPYRPPPTAPPVAALTVETAAWWRAWVAGLDCDGEWRDAVVRSLITLKALSYAPTGGLVAAPTTSLPQQPAGVRNWDYRYCWIHDGAAAVAAFAGAGARPEAARLMTWLTDVTTGPAAQVQPVYRVAGERRLPELEVAWLPGHDGARPVRIGNAAAQQVQPGVLGYLLRARLAARQAGLPVSRLGTGLDDGLPFLRGHWAEPDPGLWETRGPLRQFVHSKVLICVAADAAAALAAEFGEPQPVTAWRQLGAAVRADILARGYDPGRNTFCQHYGSPLVDAALLQLPLLGFLPAGDPRVAGTAERVGRELDDSGVLRRYRADRPADADGLPPGEAGYLPATFWLAELMAAAGRPDQARAVFTALLALRNDVGLLAEGYDPLRRRLAGNHPSTAAHLGLIAAARAVSLAGTAPQFTGGDGSGSGRFARSG